ncbi:hypothetical protein ACWGSK_00265 [Nocardiopsis sp. NPDC055551]
MKFEDLCEDLLTTGRRVLAAGAIAGVAVFGVAACEDGGDDDSGVELEDGGDGDDGDDGDGDDGDDGDDDGDDDNDDD